MKVKDLKKLLDQLGDNVEVLIKEEFSISDKVRLLTIDNIIIESEEDILTLMLITTIEE